MFSSLANYLFGSSTTADTITDPATNTNNIESTINKLDDKLNKKKCTNFCDNTNKNTSETSDDEGDIGNDWLLIDREDEESLPRTDSEGELPLVEIKNSPLFQQKSLRKQRNQKKRLQVATLSPNRDGALSQSLYVVSAANLSTADASFNLPASMEESWFLTPPPIFTSTGPINMELSPFENLLIEHPSMSVYHSIRSAQEATESFVNLDLGFDEAKYIRQVIDEGTPIHAYYPIPLPSASRVARVNGPQIKQDVLFRKSQKAHDKKEKQNISRGAIKRGNKVRDFQSNGGNRPRRSDMQHCKTVSGSNNNRKC